MSTIRHRTKNSLSAFIFALLIAGQGSHAAVTESEVLQATIDVGNWLEANVVEESVGLSWPDNVLSPDTISYDLAAGVAGKVLFFTGLYNATGNEKYLTLAQRGADYLVARLQDASNFDGNRRRASLYSGISGIGVALINVYRAAPDERYESAIVRVVDLLDDWSMTSDVGIHWSDEFNDLLYGEAGTVLFLSFVADQTGNEKAKQMALSGAQFLLSQGVLTDEGAFWYFRRGRDFNLPNFSHGTAGVGYTLSSVAMVTGAQAIAIGAVDAFKYLRSIARSESGRTQVPYGWGNEAWDGLFEFGWAHGIAGTALFPERLVQADVMSDAADEFRTQLLSTLININLPGSPAEPFSEPSTALDVRFGRSGVLGVISSMDRALPGVTEIQDALYTHIRDAAVRNIDSLHWEIDAPEFMGGGTAAYTGYLHGAAGIGLAFLKLHANLINSESYIVMPDDPFSWSIE